MKGNGEQRSEIMSVSVITPLIENAENWPFGSLYEHVQ